ncbi:MAG TPA: GNAT family N-acetyltransferase [Planctomycetaceae bacterium]|nr:GNAT family N-acetyltransferase [Planctomycetaceae bacterium]
MSELTLREATFADVDLITDFNCRLAEESEGKLLDRQTVCEGVKGLLCDSSRGRYFLAVRNGQVVGQLMHTREWSDWRNGDIWWLQSVYVHSDFRGQGVFRALFQHIERMARETSGVVGLRLYVEHENHTAQAVYKKLGMSEGGYRVMELMHESANRNG